MAHREICPSSILLTPSDKKARLAHVGLMKGFNERDPLDGNEYFAAPELFGNAILQVSDIWSLGVVFAHLLQTFEERTASPLFRGSTDGDVQSILQAMIDLTCSSNAEIDQMCSQYAYEKQDVFKGLQLGPKQTLSSRICRANADELDLLGKMLQFVPSKRATAEALLKHDYFKKNVPNLDTIVL